MKGSLAFIYGGRGLEREVSILGADLLLPLVEKCGYGCIPVYIDSDGRWTVCRRGDEFLRPDKYDSTEYAGLINLGGRGGLSLGGESVVIDCAFPLLHGDFGEDGSVQGALENASIPYVGEGIFNSVVCLDKAACRALADRLSLPGAKWISLPFGIGADEAADIAESGLSYPMFLKPRYLGSSIGAGLANSREDFVSAYGEASANSSRCVIVEERVDINSELEIGVIRAKGKYIFTKIGQIQNENGFYSYREKYSADSSTEVKATCEIDEKITSRILEYGKRLANALCVRSLARMDFFLDKEGEIYFNEINTMPGFTASSLFPNLFSEIGIDARELLDILISEAMR